MDREQQTVDLALQPGVLRDRALDQCARPAPGALDHLQRGRPGDRALRADHRAAGDAHRARPADGATADCPGPAGHDPVNREPVQQDRVQRAQRLRAGRDLRRRMPHTGTQHRAQRLDRRTRDRPSLYSGHMRDAGPRAAREDRPDRAHRADPGRVGAVVRRRRGAERGIDPVAPVRLFHADGSLRGAGFAAAHGSGVDGCCRAGSATCIRATGRRCARSRWW